MSRPLSLFLCLALLTSACENEAPVLEEEGEPTTEEVVEEEAEVKEEAATFESSRETTVATGSSELEDDTAYGFAYNSSNVLDLDYSTSWCSTEEGVPQVLTLSFPEVTKLGTVGIVGGYARDEKIFLQNNRLKTVEVWYDDLPEAVDELHFEDTYGMQFFDLTQEEAQTVKFKIMETYPGSKYTDTCVAEVDLWSDWVEQKDADAAYNYYLEYKEAFATRPVGIEKVEMAFLDYPDAYINACGQVDTSLIEETYFEDGMSKGITNYYDIRTDEFLYSYNSNYDFWGTDDPKQVVLYAQMNDWAKAGDEISIRWLEGRPVNELGSETVYNTIVGVETLEVENCNDALSVSGTIDLTTTFSYLRSYKVQLYYKDRFIGEETFSLGAQ